MDDTNPQARPPEPSPALDDTQSVRADDLLATPPKIVPATVEQPTIVTNEPPIPAPANSDSGSRILDGRVALGDRLGHFELVEYVGGGGMGRVFRAIDTRLGRHVALKILPPELAAGADALQRFHNEAQSAARLDHENIARVYYVGEDRGLAFIVFEFVEGKNVRLLVQEKGPLPLAEALSYTLQTAEALSHADARGVVHRDIKPSNMLITPEGRVKLIDMGLARLRNADSPGADLTQSGVTLGTFDYISPEQARDPRNADARSDIYSLGCTLFFMLTGRPPFPDGTVLQKLLQHQGDEPPDVRQFRPELPEALSRLLAKMMAKDPNNRPTNSAELAGDLLRLADQFGLQPMSPGVIGGLTTASTASFLRRRLPWIVPVAALAIIVGLVEIFSKPPAAVSAKTGTTAKSGKTSARSPAKNHAPAAVSGGTTGKAAKNEVLIVGESGTEEDGTGTAGSAENVYSSLAAACAAARDGDVIELRFNGPREERPVKITNVRVTIRAGEGYRPTLVFRPTEVNPVKYPRSMFTLSAGRLTLVDVAMELRVPRAIPADSWSMLETCGGQTLRLEHCLLTIRNASDRLKAYHRDVAFIRARPSPDAATEMDLAPSAPPLATLELADCVARGEAAFLCIEDLQPVSLTWENGLLATTGQLLLAGGGATPPKSEEPLNVELRHLTAVVRGGLCRLSATPSAPYQQTVQFTCADDVFITPPDSALVEQDGVAGMKKARQRFAWTGDRNFYQDTDVFWKVRTADAQVPPDAMTFERWTAYWGPSRENQPSCSLLSWKQPPEADQPLHARTPNDYTLMDPTFNDASEGAPGLQQGNLPPPPSEPE
jgi:serine/threonine-protein kinase